MVKPSKAKNKAKPKVKLSKVKPKSKPQIPKATPVKYPKPNRILAFDPGVVNFGACLLVEGKPIKTYWVKAQQNIKDDGVFLNSIIDLIDETKPDFIIAERYQFRGRQSIYVEVVSQMLGRLAMLTRLRYNIELNQVSAAQWKTFYKVKKLPKGVWSLFPEEKNIFEAVHQVDAAAIGKYGYERLSQL